MTEQQLIVHRKTDAQTEKGGVDDDRNEEDPFSY